MKPVQPDKVRTSLRRLIDSRGVDMATVSRAIGKNHAYIQQFLTRGVPAELSYKAAMALAAYFECSPDVFGITVGQPIRPSNDAQKEPLIRHPLAAIRKLMGLSPAQMAKALNEKEAAINAIERGAEPISEKMLLKICRTFKIDPEDLAGYAPALSADERVMLLRFRGLSPEQRNAFETMLNSFEKERA